MYVQSLVFQFQNNLCVVELQSKVIVYVILKSSLISEDIRNYIFLKLYLDRQMYINFTKIKFILNHSIRNE